MTAGTLLYEGKAKKVFATDKPDQVVQYFKDDATAFNAQKRGTIVEKGVINNKVSERLFRLLEQAGVPTHFVERLSDRELLTKKVTIVPVEVVVMNAAPADLVHHILRDGILLLDRDRAARIRFEVQSRNEYFDLAPLRRLYRRLPEQRS